MAFMVGVGAAVAIGGAIMGTIFTQTSAAMSGFNLSSAGQHWFERLSEGVVMLVGTITSPGLFPFWSESNSHRSSTRTFGKSISLGGSDFYCNHLWRDLCRGFYGGDDRSH